MSRAARLQTELSRAAHLKPSLKSSEDFPSSEYFERASSKLRVILTIVSRDLNLRRDNENGGSRVFMALKTSTFHGIIFFLINNKVVADETLFILHEQ
ncbi:hypothetical protein Hanom_Chr07g00580911 [Helianthus anomalus]